MWFRGAHGGQGYSGKQKEMQTLLLLGSIHVQLLNFRPPVYSCAVDVLHKQPPFELLRAVTQSTDAESLTLSDDCMGSLKLGCTYRCT